MHSIFRGEAMRSLMIEHAAKIPEINPSAARFALDEMLGFVLVRISVLGNIFSARDLHSSLFNLCFPHCVSLRDAFRFRALMMPIRAIMGRAVGLADKEQGFDCGLPLLEILLGLGELLDIVRGVLEGYKLAA